MASQIAFALWLLVVCTIAGLTMLSIALHLLMLARYIGAQATRKTATSKKALYTWAQGQALAMADRFFNASVKAELASAGIDTSDYVPCRKYTVDRCGIQSMASIISDKARLENKAQGAVTVR